MSQINKLLFFKFMNQIFSELFCFCSFSLSAKKWPFLTPDWSDFSSVGIGKVRWGRRREVLITPHQHRPSLEIFEKKKIGEKWIKNGDKIYEQFKKLDGEEGERGPNHTKPASTFFAKKN